MTQGIVRTAPQQQNEVSTAHIYIPTYVYSKHGEVRSLPQSLRRSPQLHAGICWTGSYLTLSEGRAGLSGVVMCLWTCATCGISLSRGFSLCRGGRGADTVLGPYHGGRRPSIDDRLHSPTVIPPSALDKPSIMKRYHRRRTTR